MRLSISHRTVYQYARPVANSVNEAWLRPLTDERQSCLSFRLTTTPPSSPRPYTDYYGNTVYHFDIPEPHTRLEILAEAEVITQDIDLASLLAGDPSPYQPLSPADRDRWLDFLSPTPLTTAGPALQTFARDIAARHTRLADLVLDLSVEVHAALRYEAGVTGVNTTAEESFELGAGVCQDHTHVFLAVARALGIPSRYLSGYLCTGAGPDQSQAMHAWPEALLPGAGWVGLDPANGRLVDGHYVRVAIGRDYTDVPPVRGAYSGPSGAGLDVSVYVLNDQQQ